MGTATERAQHLEVGVVILLVTDSVDGVLLYGRLRGSISAIGSDPANDSGTAF